MSEKEGLVPGRENGKSYGSTKSGPKSAEERITLTWDDINVYVPGKTKMCGKSDPVASQPKHILKNVTGIVAPGSLVAIMGASGAGKSTLLNVLTYRNRGNLAVDGDVRVNGKPVGKGITSVSAYVQQDDMFVGILTVREHLMFQAMLRMDQGYNNEQRKRRTDDVITELGLSKCAGTMIGIPGRLKCISGGEMKRLSFASEVLTNPPLMFCDEPTSGLDSFMAEQVIQTLKEMAANGKTILCTIHQPASQVFAMFDRLLLMAEGRVAFLGESAVGRSFFSRVGFQCPQQFNPADYYIHTLAVVPGQEVECKDRVRLICDMFEQSPERAQITADIEAQHEGSANIFSDGIDFENMSPYKASYLRQFRHVLWRSWVTNARDKTLTVVRLLQNLIIALFAGLLYLGQELDQKGVQNINGALFLIITNSTFSNAFSVINAFPQELPIFKREHQNGMYRTSVYYICKSLADIPIFTVLPLVFVSVLYWMVGLNSAWQQFLVCIAVTVLLTNVVISFGYLISTLAGDISIALALAGPVCVPLMLFGGFFLNDASIPVYFIWLEYISWFKYTNEILVVNQWQGITNITCDFNATSRCFNTGAEVIASLNYNPDNILFDWLMLVALLVAFRVLAYVCLALRANSK